MRGWLIAGLVVIWATRLGSFLFIRVKQDGRDGRFDELKISFPRFLMVWTLQGLWVTLTFAAGIAAITSAARAPLGALAWTGVALWTFGFVVESIADAQKRAHRKRDEKASDFITEGLWAWSRHPNYFGEIVLARHRPDRGRGSRRLAVGNDDLTRIRLRAAHPDKRRAHARSPRQETLGRGSGVPGLSPERPGALATPAEGSLKAARGSERAALSRRAGQPACPCSP